MHTQIDTFSFLYNSEYKVFKDYFFVRCGIHHWLDSGFFHKKLKIVFFFK